MLYMSTLLYTSMPQHTVNKAALTQRGVEDGVACWILDGGPEVVHRVGADVIHNAATAADERRDPGELLAR
jgi:hypothetical protein